MTYTPLVTILVLNFNHAPYLEDCLRSIFSQSYQHVEVIVADDASTDNSLSVLEKYGPKLTVVASEKNRGIVGNFNNALKWVTGEYVFLVDADDYVEPDILSNLVEATQDGSVQVVGCQVRTFGAESGVSNFPLSQEDITACLFIGPAITNSGSLIQTALLNSVRKKECLAHDYLWWIDAVASGATVLNISEIGLNYRKHDRNETLLNHARLDIAEGDYRVKALELLSCDEAIVTPENKRLQYSLLQVGEKNTPSILKKKLQWLDVLRRSVGAEDSPVINLYYAKYAMRVARAHAKLGWKVPIFFCCSPFRKCTGFVDIVALCLMAILRCDSKHSVSPWLKKVFYFLKRRSQNA